MNSQIKPERAGPTPAFRSIPEPPLSLPITDDYDWEDDFDFGSDAELPEEMRWPELGSADAGDEPPGAPDEAWLNDPDGRTPTSPPAEPSSFGAVRR